MLHKLLNKYKSNPKKVFLIDASGALITAIVLFGILIQFEPLFGMPREVLYVLSGIAFFLFLYSILCYLLIKKRWIAFIGLLMILNLSYIFISLGMVIRYYENLTKIGVLYFMIELIVIGFVIRLEYGARTTLKKNEAAGN